MSETRATAPVFPPGRYGRRRDGRRRRWLPVLVGVLVAALLAGVSVRLYQRYGNPDYDAQVVTWTDDSATEMTIKFTVRVPAGGAASCMLRARTYDGAEAGRRLVTVSATGDSKLIEASETVPTSSRAFVGEVLRCRAPE